MLVIVEGFDNTGKTSLIQGLSEDLKLLVMNNRRKPPSEAYMEQYLRTVCSLGQDYPVILDRLCTISEPVYGVLRGRGPVITSEQEARHLHILRASDPLIIYCRPPTGVVLNFGDRPQMDGVISNARSLLSAYDSRADSMARDGFRVVHWDFTNYGYPWILNQVINYMESK